VQASRPEIIGSDQATKNRSKSDIEREEMRNLHLNGFVADFALVWLIDR
jgi:hypothetical protein